MPGKFLIHLTGEVIDTPDIEIRMYQPEIEMDGKVVSVADALSQLFALRDYWRARALRFESELGDLRASRQAEPDDDESRGAIGL